VLPPSLDRRRQWRWIVAGLVAIAIGLAVFAAI
jgi:hypothetical protein